MHFCTALAIVERNVRLRRRKCTYVDTYTYICRTIQLFSVEVCISDMRIHKADGLYTVRTPNNAYIIERRVSWAHKSYAHIHQSNGTNIGRAIPCKPLDRSTI